MENIVIVKVVVTCPIDQLNIIKDTYLKCKYEVSFVSPKWYSVNLAQIWRYTQYIKIVYNYSFKISIICQKFIKKCKSPWHYPIQYQSSSIIINHHQSSSIIINLYHYYSYG
ncbi:hypothetical protein ACTFIW_013330 [Dictyostelium discoideum]